MEYSELIKIRQSCRNYSGEPVDRSAIEQVLDQARLAPSACNSQPWFFTAISSEDAVKKTGKAVQHFGFNKFAEKAGAFIVVEQREPKLKEGVTKVFGSRHFADNDIGIVVAHIVLACANLGLGSCILGMFNKNEIAEIIGAKDKAEIKLVIAVGKPAEGDAIRNKIRKDLSDIAKFI